VTDLLLQSDPEKLVIGWLGSVAEVAAICGTHISTTTVVDGACIRVGLAPNGVAGGQVPRYAVRYRLQLEFWGTTQAEASLLARTAMAALADRSFLVKHAEGVPSNVVMTPHHWNPDDSQSGDKARPRYIADLFVTVHP
jgi:hypothetical protein